MLIYCFFKFFRFESPGAVFACVQDLAVGADEIETFGPGDICFENGIVDVVDVSVDAVLHGGFAFACYFAAFFKRSGVVDAGIFEFPSVFWMGFSDIDDEKLDLIVIGIIKIAEADRLFDKGRSREAAKDECNGFLCANLRKTHRIFAIGV